MSLYIYLTYFDFIIGDKLLDVLQVSGIEIF